MSVVISVLGHVGLSAGIALAPALAARDRAPIEFVQVQIVPLQALGVPEPAPPARPRQEETATPEPVIVPESTNEPSSSSKRDEEDRSAPVPERQRSRSQDSGADQQVAAGVPDGPAQRRGSPQGSPFATSPFGTAVAGFDNPDFVYGYYVERMLAMIGSNWVRPKGETDLEMMIRFRIGASGALSEIEIVEPSGSSSFDLAGMRAVRLASPLPPLPRSFPHDSLGVNLIIR